MIRINNVHIPLDYSDEVIIKKAAKELRVDKNAIKSSFKGIISAINRI